MTEQPVSFYKLSWWGCATTQRSSMPAIGSSKEQKQQQQQRQRYALHERVEGGNTNRQQRHRRCLLIYNNIIRRNFWEGYSDLGFEVAKISGTKHLINYHPKRTYRAVWSTTQEPMSTQGHTFLSTDNKSPSLFRCGFRYAGNDCFRPIESLLGVLVQTG